MSDAERNGHGHCLTGEIRLEPSRNPPSVDLCFVLDGTLMRLHFPLALAKDLRRKLTKAIRAAQPEGE